MRQSEGALSREADAWRGELLDMLATVAAALDFSDEGDVDVVSAAEVAERSSRLATSIGAALDGARQGELIRQGATVVLAGPPNAGKSSLLNALARRDVALVSPHAGTTRDWIEVALDLRGLPVVVVDTAGLRDARDPVEQMGIERTRSRAARADLVLWLTETGADPPADLSHAIPVRTKLDLSSPVGVGSRTLAVSVLSGEGIDDLLDWIHQRVAALAGGGEPALVTHERQRQLRQRALAVLRGISHDMPLEILAEHLRLATVALAELVGRLDVEEVLGAVFGRFCSGK
jgi:tRNA modification GTPase